MDNANFVQVVPNSHLWPNIATLLNWLKHQKDSRDMSTIEGRQELIEYLEVGLNNTLKNGCDIGAIAIAADSMVKSPIYQRDITYAAQTAPPPAQILKEGEDPNFNWRKY